jgi:hypothetical protein
MGWRDALNGEELSVFRAANDLSDVDRRALTPLFWSNVNPYGRFRLNMDRHLDLQATQAGLPGGPPLAIEPATE